MHTSSKSQRTKLQISLHAAKRYIQRFAGNLTVEQASVQLQQILRTARRRRSAPGGATVYGTYHIEIVVKDGMVLTVYRPSQNAVPYALEA